MLDKKDINKINDQRVAIGDGEVYSNQGGSKAFRQLADIELNINNKSVPLGTVIKNQNTRIKQLELDNAKLVERITRLEKNIVTLAKKIKSKKESEL